MVEKQEEEPLDPAVEAIRVKMVRLLMVSGGIMMLGLMAVLAVIVYKVSGNDTPGPQNSVSGLIGIPKGATVLSTSSDGEGLLLTVKRADGATVIQRHNAAGQLISTYTIIEE